MNAAARLEPAMIDQGCGDCDVALFEGFRTHTTDEVRFTTRRSLPVTGRRSA